MSPRTVDARGLRCPWPALRLARAMREAEGAIELLADDPQARREAAALAEAHGWSFEQPSPQIFRVVPPSA